MLSPLPFFEPVGAVRIGLIEGNLVVNPNLQDAEGADLDLIVVGTKDALTMVEASGRTWSRRRRSSRRSSSRTRSPQALRGAGGAPREGRQGEVARHGDDGRARRDPGRADPRRDPVEIGLRESAGTVHEIQDELAPPLTMESSEDDVVRQVWSHSSLNLILERERLEVVKESVKQFGRAPRLTDAETTRSIDQAGARCSSTGSSSRSSCPSRSARLPGRASRSSRTA